MSEKQGQPHGDGCNPTGQNLRRDQSWNGCVECPRRKEQGVRGVDPDRPAAGVSGQAQQPQLGGRIPSVRHKIEAGYAKPGIAGFDSKLVDCSGHVFVDGA